MEAWQADPYRWHDVAEVLRYDLKDGRHVARLTPTILFPEGGGQPADRGTVGGVAVLDVQKDAEGVAHVLAGPVPVGPAAVVVDGARRLDHMQQHTGQHLLTAVWIARHDVGTTSFHLGPDHVAIELDHKHLDPAAVADVEAACNQVIREARGVTSEEVAPDEVAARGVRSRGLPEGFSGRVRLLGIDGIDLNTCGGTHVRSTAEIGAIKLLSWEPVGTRGSRLYFVCGDRLLRRVHTWTAREAALNKLLSTSPDQHLAAVGRLMDERTALLRRIEALEKAESEALAERLVALRGGPVVHAWPDVPLARLQQLAGALTARDPHRLFLLTAPVGDGGSFLLAGPADEVARLGPKLAEVYGGRGGGARGRYQGKAVRWPEDWAVDAVLRGG